MLQPQLNNDPRRLISGHIDWDTFSIGLDNLLLAPQSLSSIEDVDLYVQHFTDSLISATKSAIYKYTFNISAIASSQQLSQLFTKTLPQKQTSSFTHH